MRHIGGEAFDRAHPLPQRVGHFAQRPRQLADLIAGVKSEITTLPSVNHCSQNWEPEPFRYLGVHYIQDAYWRIDQKAERTGIAPSGKTLAERLTRQHTLDLAAHVERYCDFLD